MDENQSWQYESRSDYVLYTMNNCFYFINKKIQDYKHQMSKDILEEFIQFREKYEKMDRKIIKYIRQKVETIIIDSTRK
jgi:hypothetical protein